MGLVLGPGVDLGFGPGFDFFPVSFFLEKSGSLSESSIIKDGPHVSGGEDSFRAGSLSNLILGPLRATIFGISESQ